MKLTLKQWRGLRNMTQAELADAVGVSSQTISNWELGETTPAYKHLKKLSEVLETGGIDNIILPAD